MASSNRTIVPLIYLTAAGNRELTATILWQSLGNDLAVLRVSHEAGLSCPSS